MPTREQRGRVCVAMRVSEDELRFLTRYARECGLETVGQAGEMIAGKLAGRLRRQRALRERRGNA